MNNSINNKGRILFRGDPPPMNSICFMRPKKMLSSSHNVTVIAADNKQPQ